jgi:type IV secretory pathway VirB10-like protein
MMGYVKVDFVDAYEVKEIPGKVGEVILLPAEKYNELKKALTDKLAGVEPAKPKSALEVENELLRERLERQDQAIEQLRKEQLAYDEKRKAKEEADAKRKTDSEEKAKLKAEEKAKKDAEKKSNKK